MANQSVDGLTVNGITFSFTVGGSASTDAFYNSVIGPTPAVFIALPALEGTAAGILQLDFAVPTSALSFGLALNSPVFTGLGATVQLFDSSLIPFGGLRPLNISPLKLTSEGQFSVVVPEPATLALFGFGLLGLGAMRRRMRTA